MLKETRFDFVLYYNSGMRKKKKLILNKFAKEKVKLWQ